MIHVYLCDDNEVLLKRYQNKLSDIALAGEYPVTFSCFLSGESLLFHLETDPNKANIIFLDVHMGGINGIEAARKLRSMGCHSELIFLTSSEEFVFESFDSLPLHYLIKGSSGESEKLEDVFLKAIQLSLRKEAEGFLCEANGQKRRIPLHTISYFEINSRIVTVHFQEGTFDFYSTIESIDAELSDKKFVRCHRSYLVNLHYIDIIEKSDILLTTGERIPLGNTYAKDVKLAFSASLSDIF